MDVYVDCNFQGSIPFKNIFRDLPDVDSVEVVSVLLENGEIRSLIWTERVAETRRF